jgi:hypothetical protein
MSLSRGLLRLKRGHWYGRVRVLGARAWQVAGKPAPNLRGVRGVGARQLKTRPWSCR